MPSRIYNLVAAAVWILFTVWLVVTEHLLLKCAILFIHIVLWSTHKVTYVLLLRYYAECNENAAVDKATISTEGLSLNENYLG